MTSPLVTEGARATSKDEDSLFGWGHLGVSLRPSLFLFSLLPLSLDAQSLPASAPSSQASPPATSAPATQPTSQAESTPGEGAPILLDMMHLIKVAQSAGWKIDKYEIEKLMPDALQSVCRVRPSSREAALTTLHEQINLSGGPVELLYQKNPKLRKLRKQLTLDRAQALLTEASRRAAADCPFYLQPEDDFQSLQGIDRRFLFVIESEGSAQIEKKGDQLAYGGGGFGRLLFGKGFDKASLFSGVEVAGSGLLVLGAPASEFEVRYSAAIPVVLRWTSINWQYEVETAPVFLVDDTDFRLSYGIRAAAGVGVHAHRRQGFLPWGGLSVGLDHFFEGVRPTTELLHIGFRAGFIFN